ncbi:MAG: tRNA uridine-5-carboxymethylaminomethyl(34) synthesis GTPase MnmE [Clostridiales bacterium]|jgi:tRNA modification GTPase|nr:tRNA uridine-5-carboxymethylaminomethyl(34) synthesis GTPase MnmE [Clostridiales bacterium]
MNGDIIAAIATPPGVGALGVVRLSGENCEKVLEKIFTGRPSGGFVSRKMYHGRITDGGKTVDEVMCAVYRAPRSYTKEDSAEIFTHGGFQATHGVLNAALNNGARQALPGEFTQRAFLNGRMDLSQAEAVAELIHAKSEAARSAGLRQLGGGISRAVGAFRDRILKWLASIALSIDYPEHESEALNLSAIQSECGILLPEMRKLADTYKAGKIITEGVRAVITGRPNVGKSSLLNAILKEDRAIVTEIPGTTRDVLTEPVSVRGVPLLLADTAGMRETSDILESRGVDKSREYVNGADLVLWVLDGSQPPQKEDYDIAVVLRGKKVIPLLNKRDLPRAGEWARMGSATDPANSGFFETGEEPVPVSARTGEGLNALYEKIEEIFLSGLGANAAEADMLTRERHFILLNSALDSLTEASAAIGSGFTEDLVSVHLTEAYHSLGEILGQNVGEDILDRIFSEFCVGK